MNRRQFLQITGLAGGALCLRPFSSLAEMSALTPAPEGPFSFVLLGDMHFARPIHYEPGGMNSYARKVCDLTAAAWDDVWDEIAAQLRELDPQPAFVLQVGDYVHGDCPTAEKSLEHYDDFVRSIRRHQLPVPLFLARGNHELQGKGAREAYETHMPEWLREVGPLTRGAAYYSFDAGPAVHVTVLDVYGDSGRGGSLDARQLAWLEQDLTAYRRRAPEGLAILVSHAPLFPMTPRGAIFDVDAAAHGRLIVRLMHHKVNAVLCGHLHTVSTMTYTDAASGHRLTQFMTYSLIGAGEVKAQSFRTPAYDPEIILPVEYRKPEELDAMRQIVKDVGPQISGYRSAQIPGYQVVRVDPKAGITIESYRGLGKRVFDVFKMPG
jgi:3',5'-cyclic AMP phosphodiesterase CpdA